MIDNRAIYSMFLSKPATSALLVAAAAAAMAMVLLGSIITDAAAPVSIGASPLSPSFYAITCPSLQTIVANGVASRLQIDRSAVGPLLRLFFHDCFVRGCDASVLLKSTTGGTERDAVPNQTLREFGLIDSIKVQVEQACPGVVSCADIVAVAAMEAVAQSGGPKWEVEMGRRDGRISMASEASALPSSLSSAQDLILIFASKALSIRDMVTLSGAHTIGGAHCFQAARRFYGFNSPTGIDPTLNTTYAQTLRSICHQPIDAHFRVPLDASTPSVFDNTYFQNLLVNKGLFTSDSSLMNDARTKPIVQEYAMDQRSFFSHFISSMMAMGRIGVLTGNQGEIRKHCESINHI